MRFFESFQASSEALTLQYNKSFHQLDPREFFTEYAMWEKLAVYVHENDRSGKPPRERSIRLYWTGYIVAVR